MKTLRLLFLALIVAVSPISCSTPERAVFSAAKASRLGVQEAVSLFRLQVKLGKVDADHIVLADKWLEVWKSATKNALLALKEYEKTGDSSSWDKAVLVSGQAYTALVEVLTPFVVELQKTK